jgi:uncharacterized protein with ParB-like and HNH nuclease domain
MHIEPKNQTIEELLSGLTTRFSVPSYQRDYSWTQDNFDELWSDIVSAWERSTSYFMGTIVLNAENIVSGRGYDIVDGQQRLATFSVLFSVIRDRCVHFAEDSSNSIYAKVNVLDSDNKKLAERTKKLSECRLLHVSEPDHYFLELNPKDQPTFFNFVQKISPALNSESEWKIAKKDHRLVKAKKLLSKKVATDFLIHHDGFVRLHKFVAHLITQLQFLRIEVKTDTDAYLLFESLNNRGLDLSISDLVKNRILLVCGNNTDKKKRILEKWDGMVELLGRSRYPQPQEFLRFYWLAFHGSTTKKELYSEIKRYLARPGVDVESFIDDLGDSAENFTNLTEVSLTYPSGSYSANSKEQYLAELNTLGYSVCYPLLLKVQNNRLALLETLLPVLLTFLFRLISVGGFAAGRAEAAVTRALTSLQDGRPNQEIVNCFIDDEITDDRFAERVRYGRFDDNHIARYLLSKIYDYDSTPALRLTKEVQLEHVLPVEHNLWSFDAKGRDISDWLYSIGNLTLLEEALNKRIQNKLFTDKIAHYQEKNGEEGFTAIKMTYKIHQQFVKNGRDWNAEWVAERAEQFSKAAIKVWPLPTIPQLAVEPGIN